MIDFRDDRSELNEQIYRTVYSDSDLREVTECLEDLPLPSVEVVLQITRFAA